jgi:hypothetical protein
MRLADIVVPKLPVHVSEDQAFDVRGLTTQEIGQLVLSHYATIKGVFDKTLDWANVIKDFPELVTELIAMGADSPEPEALDVIADLPFGVQLNALTSIWALSHISVSDLGNLARAVIQGMEGLAEHLPDQVTPESDDDKPSTSG